AGRAAGRCAARRAGARAHGPAPAPRRRTPRGRSRRRGGRSSAACDERPAAPRSLRGALAAPPMSPRRVTVVASELLGRPGTGGAGTADSLLAVALGRRGHDVRLLIATGRDVGPPSDEWARIYDGANVEI